MQILQKPNDLDLNLKYAQQQGKMGNFKQTISTLERLNMLYPDNVEIKLYLLSVLVQVDSPEKANTIIEEMKLRRDLEPEDLETLMEIEESLPTDIDWILQIEGHTDSLPVKAGQTYRDNWELSTKRALSVLRYLIKQGIEPSRLSASGYGSFQPIDVKNTKSARMKNRRIEMKITQNTKIK